MQEKLLYARGNVQKGKAWACAANVGWFGSTELHGPFVTENEAHNYGIELMTNRVDVTAVEPCRIELNYPGGYRTTRDELAPWTPEQENFPTTR